MDWEATLDSYLSDWIASGRSVACGRIYCGVMRRWGRVPTLQEARSKIAELAPRPAAANEARALKSFSRWWAEETDTADHLARLKMPKTTEPAAPLTAKPSDVERLLSACTGEHSLRDRALITVAADTGLRRSELARMELEHVDTASGCILVPRAKSGRPRIVPISSRSARALRRYLRVRGGAPGALWIGRKGPLTIDGITQAFGRRSEAAGVLVTPHSLRRGFAVRWLTEGGSQASLQTIAGWSSGAMVTRYVRACSAELALDEARRLLG